MIRLRNGYARCVAFSVVTLLASACAGGPRHELQPAIAAGAWEGEARTGNARLPFSLLLEEGPDGWRGTVDVPSHYALGYPLMNVTVHGLEVAFAFPDLLPRALFAGVLDRDRMRGVFTGPLGPDTLRGTFELRRRLREPAPYAPLDTAFHNGALRLAATVYRPRALGAHPAIVFVHGSGPQTRDSYIRWFADRFARAGFVTLIYDKRGTGGSGGAPWPQTSGSFTDLAADAVAGARFLASQTYVDADHIGIWGLSQGAWVAPLAAAQAPDVLDFLVLLSGGGVTPAEQELYDDEARLRDLGFDASAIEEALAYLRLADEYVRTRSDDAWNRFAAARDEARTRRWYAHLDRFPQILPREAPVWAGMRADLDYDPTPVLSTLRIPILLILGEEDRLTPARETADRVRRAFDSSGNRHLTVRVLPSAGHALTTQPPPPSPWLAERPAGNWVSEMIQWARRLR